MHSPKNRFFSARLYPKLRNSIKMSRKSRNPLIGITTYGRLAALPFSLPSEYIDAVRASGGIPILLPPGEVEPAILLDSLDGLIISGGGDIHPACYKGFAHHIALLSAADNDYLSYVDQNFQPELLQTWGKRGSVINVEMRRYRESVLAGLVEDGYTVIDANDADDDESGAVIESVIAASEELYIAECEAIAQADELSPTELKKLQDKRAKTKIERHQQRKAELSRRYEVEVTPDLVEKDDDGWYPQLRMHYYLTLGREFLTNRDAKRAKSQLEAGENSIWKPDFNKGQLLPAVLLLESLNLLQFLTPGVELRSSDEQMLEFKALAVRNRHIIKNYLNVSISEKLTPVA